jgi:hypothetical protein
VAVAAEDEGAAAAPGAGAAPADGAADDSFAVADPKIASLIRPKMLIVSSC